MTTANWNVTTINGVAYLVIDLAQFRIPLDWDPSSSMFLAVAAPNAAVQAAIGVGSFPALLKGPKGDTPTLSDIINFTPLAYDDATPDSASWTEIGTNQYQLNLALHQGQPGPAATNTILASGDLTGTPIPGMLMAVNASGTGLTFVSPLCGDRYVPATVKSTPSGNAGYTLAPVTIPPQNADWRPGPEAQCVITPGGADCAVDLIARLSNSNTDGGETTGNDIGRAIGLSNGVPVNQVMTGMPPTNSGDAFDRVPAGQAATVFFRAERQTGSDYFTTAAAKTRLGVRVHPCPTTVGAVEVGGTPVVGPLTIAITAAGTFTQAVPSWANYVDIITLGDGGGGGAALLAAGSAGAGTSATAGSNTVHSAGGSGGASGSTSSAGAAGVGAGAYALNGFTYTGGDSVAAAQAGSAPGGGGGGSSVLGVYGYGGGAGVFESATYPVSGVSSITSITGTIGAGGAAGDAGAGGASPGARGAVWLTFRQ